MSITIYHNPRCTKSRQTLELLKSKEIQPNIVEYLTDAPTVETLKNILKALGSSSPRDILRKKEAEYKELGLDNDSLSDDEILEVVVSNPKLIERPIVVNNGKAAIGRPPENVLAIL